MSVHYLEEDRKVGKINKTEIRSWLHEVVKLEGKKPGVITYIFCRDEYLADVNVRFLKKDYFTDVISFDYSEKGIISGDIMISVDRVRENAEIAGVSYVEELERIMVHGLLHLIGYDDATDDLRADMSRREDFYLIRIGE